MFPAFGKRKGGGGVEAEGGGEGFPRGQLKLRSHGEATSVSPLCAYMVCRRKLACNILPTPD